MHPQQILIAMTCAFKLNPKTTVISPIIQKTMPHYSHIILNKNVVTIILKLFWE